MSTNAWQQEIHLKAGEKLVHQSSRARGTMGQEEIDTYVVQDADGSDCGTVVVSDHTTLRGLNRTIYVVQKDANAQTIFEKRYPIPKA